jgi:hypothetical protein
VQFAGRHTLASMNGAGDRDENSSASEPKWNALMLKIGAPDVDSISVASALVAFV